MEEGSSLTAARRFEEDGGSRSGVAWLEEDDELSELSLERWNGSASSLDKVDLLLSSPNVSHLLECAASARCDDHAANPASEGFGA